MPANITDHDTWERAKKAARKTLREGSTRFYKLTMSIYTKMGGGFTHGSLTKSRIKLDDTTMDALEVNVLDPAHDEDDESEGDRVHLRQYIREGHFHPPEDDAGRRRAASALRDAAESELDGPGGSKTAGNALHRLADRVQGGGAPKIRVPASPQKRAENASRKFATLGQSAKTEGEHAAAAHAGFAAAAAHAAAGNRDLAERVHKTASAHADKAGPRYVGPRGGLYSDPQHHHSVKKSRDPLLILSKAQGAASQNASTNVGRVRKPPTNPGAQGEGSRGGHVIGHDRQGRPEYQGSNAPTQITNPGAKPPRLSEQIAAGQIPAPPAAAPGSPEAEHSRLQAQHEQLRQQFEASRQALAAHEAKMKQGGSQSGTVAGRRGAPSRSAPEAPFDPNEAGINEPSANAEQSPKIASALLSSGGHAGQTSTGKPIKLGGDTSGWNANELHEGAQAHRAAQMHLLAAAQNAPQEQKQKMKAQARKHLDEEFELTSKYVGAASQHADEESVWKSFDMDEFHPISAWGILYPEIQRSFAGTSMITFDLNARSPRLEKAVKQLGLFGEGGGGGHPTGEGSRGGHVIGHTKSGKPIYESHSHPEHASFTAGEHYEASAVHEKAAHDPDVKDIAGMEAHEHHAQALGHQSLANGRQSDAKFLKQMGRSEHARVMSAKADESGRSGPHKAAADAHRLAASEHGANGYGRKHQERAREHEKLATEYAYKDQREHNAREDAAHTGRGLRVPSDVTITSPGHAPSLPKTRRKANEHALTLENMVAARHGAGPASSPEAKAAWERVADAHTHAAKLHHAGGHESDAGLAVTAAARAKGYANPRASHNDLRSAIFKEAKGESSKLGRGANYKRAGSEFKPTGADRAANDTDASEKKPESKPGVEEANRAVKVHDHIQNFQPAHKSHPMHAEKEAVSQREDFRRFEEHVTAHHQAVDRGNIPALNAAREAGEHAASYLRAQQRGTAAGEKESAFHLKNAKNAAKRAMTLVRNHHSFKKSGIEQLDDLVKACRTPPTTSQSTHTEKSMKVQTDTLQHTISGHGAKKQKRPKKGKRRTVVGQGSPHPGATEHVNPLAVQGALTKSMLEWQTKFLGNVDASFEGRNRLRGPPMQPLIDLSRLPERSSVPATPRPTLEKSHAEKYATLAVDHALRLAYKNALAQSNAGSPFADVLTKSLMPSALKAGFSVIEPDARAVVKGAATALTDLAKIDLNLRSGLETLAVSEVALMQRYEQMGLNAAAAIHF